MSGLHELCKLGNRPITEEIYLDGLSRYLKSGIPATYTIEEALQCEKEEAGETHDGDKNEASSTTTPLHLICTHVPRDMDVNEGVTVSKMIDLLFEYGAGWCLVDVNNDTPGCILIRRGLKYSRMYEQILAAGVRAEILLRKVSEFDMEVIEDTDEIDRIQLQVASETYDKCDGTEELQGIPKTTEIPVSRETNDAQEALAHTTVSDEVPDTGIDAPDAPTHNKEAFLSTKLLYRNNALVTEDRNDGVMMSWEADLMKLGCESLFRGNKLSRTEFDDEITLLNIGFGMGIIDTMIQEKKPHKHYICEAHPDVLAKMREDGWYDKENVIILSGRWQDELNKILSLGNVFFNGIYYDTFSEQYEDMLQLYDYVVGLLKPHGVFSFFNGLGADREVVYDVYKSLVEIDLEDYGLQCTFEEVKIPDSTFDALGIQNQDATGKTVWDDVKRPYWSCPVYYHPEARFFD